MKINLKNKDFWLLAGLMALALVLRLVALFKAGTLNADDAFTVHFASMAWPSMADYLKDEVHPLLYFALMHFYLKFFGDNDLVLRLPALVFNLASLPLLYYLGKELLNKKIALLGCLFFALSYFQIFSSLQVRMYSFLEFFGLLSLVIFWQIIQKKKNYWLALMLVNLILLYTNLGGTLAILTQGLWLLIFYFNKKATTKQLFYFFLINLISLSLWLFWLIPFLFNQAGDVYQNGWYFKNQNRFGFSQGIYDLFFVLLKNYWLRLITGTIIFSAPFIITLHTDKKITAEKKFNPVWLLLAWTVPALIISLISNSSITRLYLIAHLGWYLITAYFFYLLYFYSKKIFYLLLIIWLLASAANLSPINQSISRWDWAENWLEKNGQTSPIVIMRLLDRNLAKRYLDQNTDLKTFYYFDDNWDWDRRLVKNNWKIYFTEDNLEKLKPVLSDERRLILINVITESDFSSWPRIIKPWLLKQGFEIGPTIEAPGSFTGPNLTVITRPAE